MKNLKKYKNVIIVAVICIVLLGLASYTFYRMFYPNVGVDVYGTRTDGLPNISEAVLSDLNTKFKESSLVTEVSSRVSGATIKVNLEISEETTIDETKALGQIILDNLDSDILENYDTEITFTGDKSYFPMIAYKSKLATEFTFTVNQEDEVDDEN